MTAEEEVPDRYRLGGRERRGLLAGWRGGQVASVALGLALGVAMLRMLPGGTGFAAATLFTLAGIAGACWPVRGRTVDEWGPALVRQLAMTATGERRWRDPSPWTGITSDRSPASSRARSRSFVDGIVVGEAPAGSFGVVFDGRARTCSAVIGLAGSGFALLGWEERRDRVVAWSRLLASVARDGTGVHRLQWVERCLPDDGAGPRRHFEACSVGTGPAGRSYGELLDRPEAKGVRHELYLVVTVREPRRSGRPAALNPDGAALERLARETASLEHSLRNAGAVVHGVLSCGQLRAVIGGAFSERAYPPAERAWPSAYDVEWDHLRADGLLHATYWIAEWPRSEVGNDFLVPVVTGGNLRRTISVTLAPVAPLQAARQAEQARTSGVADAEVRRRHGFAVTARARQQHDAVLAREAELAAGHASYRFSGYVSVSAPDAAQLRRGCEAMERLAAGSQLDLRRLYGAQDAGLLATLPLGRGLS